MNTGASSYNYRSDMTNKPDLHDLAQVWCKSYASPHHMTFTLDGLRNLIEAMAPPEPEPVAIVAVAPNYGATVGWMPGYTAKHNDKLYLKETNA
jgi:hypothetical protein